MNNVNVLDRIQIIWDIKNIDEPTKSSIVEYVEHGFWKIDSYLKTVLSKTDESIILKVYLEKKGTDDYIGSFNFKFPGILDDFTVDIDEDTPEKWIIQHYLIRGKTCFRKKLKNYMTTPTIKLKEEQLKLNMFANTNSINILFKRIWACYIKNNQYSEY